MAPETEEVSALPPQERLAGRGRVQAGSGPGVLTRGFLPASRLLSGRLGRLLWGRTHRHRVHLVERSQAWSVGWGSAPLLGAGEIPWGPNSEAKPGPGSKENKGASRGDGGLARPRTRSQASSTPPPPPQRLGLSRHFTELRQQRAEATQSREQSHIPEEVTINPRRKCPSERPGGSSAPSWLVAGPSQWRCWLTQALPGRQEVESPP